MAKAKKSEARVLVGIIMGSKSDWPTMEAAAKVLDEFGIAYEAEVVSAHRNVANSAGRPTGAVVHRRTPSAGAS